MMSLKTIVMNFYYVLLIFVQKNPLYSWKVFSIEAFRQENDEKIKDNFAVKLPSYYDRFFILFIIYFLSVPLCTRFLFIHLSVMFMYDVLLYIIYEKSMKKS